VNLFRSLLWYINLYPFLQSGVILLGQTLELPRALRELEDKVQSAAAWILTAREKIHDPCSSATVESGETRDSREREEYDEAGELSEG
jgi:hypothetical protein